MKESLLGRKEDIKAILKALGIKDDKKFVPSDAVETPLEQFFIEVPTVGFVTYEPVYVDDIVRKLSQGTVDLSVEKDGEKVSCNWYRAMVLAKSFGLELLSNKEYWDCLAWGLSKNSGFVDNLKSWTWTRTLIVWDNNHKFNDSLLKSLGYSGKFPIIVDSPSVIPDSKADEFHRVEGGTIIDPSDKISFFESGYFTFSDQEHKTGFPTRVNDSSNFHYEWGIGFGFSPVACGEKNYHHKLGADCDPFYDSYGFFLKKTQKKSN